MFRNLLLLIVLTLLLPATSARAQQGLGVGVFVGEPSGLSLKTWLSRATAFDAAAAWSFEDDGYFHVHGDFLVHNYNVFRVGKGAMPLYYGVGGRILNRTNNTLNVGVRLPVGAEYLFSGGPFDVYVEVVPVLDLTPESTVDVNASMGARYFFQ
jgi:hypothetical protein